MADQPSDTTLQAQGASTTNDEITQPAAAFSAAAVVEGNMPTPPAPSIETPAGNEAAVVRDVLMTDSMDDVTGLSPIPPHPQQTANTQSSTPARTGTPTMRNVAAGGGSMANGESGSRATSAHPDPGPGFTMPSEAPPHGAPVRHYINTKITGVLLEGMKAVAKEQPKDPLRMLGEFLLQKSKELEGTG